jgi:DNA-binding CsgD family transcriptional regulator
MTLSLAGPPAHNKIHLSRRELAILCLIASGFTSSGAARHLHISRYTVDQHITAMLKRSGARNRGELIARAYVTGILSTEKWPPCPSDIWSAEQSRQSRIANGHDPRGYIKL